MAQSKGTKQLGYGGSITSRGAAYVQARGEQALIKGARKALVKGPRTTSGKMVGKVQQGNSNGGGYSGGYRPASGSEFGMMTGPKATKSVPFSSKPKTKKKK